MFQRKDGTGQECVKTVQLQDETTARVSLFFLSSFLLILLTVLATQHVKEMVTFRDPLENRLALPEDCSLGFHVEE